MLLPKADVEQAVQGDMADPRTELIRQLLEYKKFKDAANLLGAAADEQVERFPRPSTIIDKLKPNAEPQIDLDQISIWNLLEAFDALMKATGSSANIRSITDDTPIDFYQIEILHRLQTEGPLSFERIFEGRSNRLVMVGLFLAMLELIRDKLIWAEQPESSTSIYVKALTDEPAEEAVRKAILATAAELANQQPLEKQQIDDSLQEQTEEADIEEDEDELDDINKLLSENQDTVEILAEPEIQILEIPAHKEESISESPVISEKPLIPIAELPPKHKSIEETAQKDSESLQQQ